MRETGFAALQSDPVAAAMGDPAPKGAQCESFLPSRAAFAPASSVPSISWKRRSINMASPSMSATKSCTTSMSSTPSRTEGARFVEELDEVPEGAVTVFSAHGVPQSVVKTAAARGLPVLDATCPLVSKVHNQGQALCRPGPHPDPDRPCRPSRSGRHHGPGRRPGASGSVRSRCRHPGHPGANAGCLYHPDHALHRRHQGHHRGAEEAFQRYRGGRKPPTSATPPRTARPRCAIWPRWRM